MKKTSILIIGFILVASCLSGQVETKVDLKQLDRYYEKMVEDWDIPRPADLEKLMDRYEQGECTPAHKNSPGAYKRPNKRPNSRPFRLVKLHNIVVALNL